MPKFDLTAFGESMLRLSPPPGETLETAARFDAHIAGAEGNVLCALAQLGLACGWSGVLPLTALGRRVARSYQSCGVTVQAVDGGGEARLGSYFLQLAPPPLSSRIVYDRKNSAAATAAADVWDWDFLLDSRAIHLTGITAALSAANHAAVQTAIQRAKAQGVLVGFDVNYRQLLWDAPTAREVLSPLIREADVVFCSRRDAAAVFGCTGAADEALVQFAKLTQARRIVMSDGADGAIASEDGKVKTFSAPKVAVVDRVGCGDAMAAGVWYGLLQEDNFFGGVQIGITLAARALSQCGDIVTVSPDDLWYSPGDIIR